MEEIVREFNRLKDWPETVALHRIRIARERSGLSIPAIDEERMIWGEQFLTAIHRPVNVNNLVTMVAWQIAEGGGYGNEASFNPINTTTPLGGSHAINGVGVQAYKTYQIGLEANVETINNGFYPTILAGLAASDSPSVMASVVGASPWGTSGALFAECVSLAAQAVAAFYHPAPALVPMEDDMAWLDKDPNNQADILVVPSSRGWFGLGSAEKAYYAANGIPEAKTAISGAVFGGLTKLG